MSLSKAQVEKLVAFYEKQLTGLRLEIENLSDALDHSVPVPEVQAITFELMAENEALRKALDDSVAALDQYENSADAVDQNMNTARNLLRGIQDEDFKCLSRDVTKLTEENHRLKSRIARLERKSTSPAPQ